MEKVIYVYDSWSSDEPILIGKLYADNIRGRELYSFEYDKSWLDNYSMSVMLDPDISLYAGRQYNTRAQNKLFGVFSDSCPDRWGRKLMNIHEDELAKIENRNPRKLNEIDYLLGVNDETRMGAIRFSLSKDGPFVATNESYPIPPICNLRELENAYREYENGSGPEKWMKELFSPGSSLGGARPKANVIDPNGNIWIAKFPSKNDEIDVGAWEIVVHDLAQLCEIDVPEAKCEKLSKYGTTYIVKRFDRVNNRRIHFSSAMTLLGKEDGSSGIDGTSYLELADYIKMSSSKPSRDLLELWKRIVFYMLVSNTDDHLRNHGFIWEMKGWKLSPMYDVNPSLDGSSLALNVNMNSGVLDLDLALSVSKQFAIKEEDAKNMINELKDKVKHSWKFMAKKYGIKSDEIHIMEKCFALAEKQ